MKQSANNSKTRTTDYYFYKSRVKDTEAWQQAEKCHVLLQQIIRFQAEAV